MIMITKHFHIVMDQIKEPSIILILNSQADQILL